MLHEAKIPILFPNFNSKLKLTYVLLAFRMKSDPILDFQPDCSLSFPWGIQVHSTLPSIIVDSEHPNYVFPLKPSSQLLALAEHSLPQTENPLMQEDIGSYWSIQELSLIISRWVELIHAEDW